MDWKNYSLGELQWLEIIDETYLVGIANKGLYKRACKDLENWRNELELRPVDSGIVCSFPDGEQCLLTGVHSTTTCSCPARETCRHILIGLLYLKENYLPTDENDYPNKDYGDSGAGKNAANYAGQSKVELPTSESAFSAVRDVPVKELRKQAGETVFREAVDRLEFGVKAAIECESVLVVSFPAEGIRVRFMPGEALDKALCSCNSASFCRHRLEAVIHYQLSLGVLDKSILTEPSEKNLPADIIQEAKQVLEEMAALGLSRLPETFPERLEQFAVICRAAGLANPERRFRQLGLLVQQYQTKQVSSSRMTILQLWAQIYGLFLALEHSSADGQAVWRLVGEYRSSYFSIPPIILHGLGAGLWASAAGYAGINYYFWSPEAGRCFSFSISRPTFYESNPQREILRLFKGMAPWGSGVEGGIFSGSKFKLESAKTNHNGRLSASEDTKADILGKTDLAALDLGFLETEDWADLVSRLNRDESGNPLGMREGQSLFLIKPCCWKQGYYDEVNQEFQLVLEDRNRHKLLLTVPYNQYNKVLIANLEKLAESAIKPERLLAEVFVKTGRLQALPIVGYYANGRMTNLSLEIVDYQTVSDGLAAELDTESANNEHLSTDETITRGAISGLITLLEQSELILDQLFLAGLHSCPSHVSEQAAKITELYTEHGMQKAALYLRELAGDLEQQRHSFSRQYGSLVFKLSRLALYCVEARHQLDIKSAALN